MKRVNFMDKYPVFTKEILKNETPYNQVDEIIAYLKQKIEDDPIAIYIGIFDHYAYTSSLDKHQIAQDIIDAKNIMCCFGDKLLVPQIAGIRPRSFGVVMTKTSFIISFLEAPSKEANTKMVEWIKDLIKSTEASDQ